MSNVTLFSVGYDQSYGPVSTTDVGAVELRVNPGWGLEDVRIALNLAVGDSFPSLEVTKRISSTLDIADAAIKDFALSLASALLLADGIIKTPILAVDSSMTVDDLVTKFSTLSIDDSVSVEDQLSKLLSLSVFSSVDTISDATEFTLARLLTLYSSLSVIDSQTKSVEKNIDDVLEVLDAFAKDWTLHLYSVLGLDDIAGKVNNVTVLDVVEILDSMEYEQLRQIFISSPIAVQSTILKSFTKALNEDFDVNTLQKIDGRLDLGLIHDVIPLAIRAFVTRPKKPLIGAENSGRSNIDAGSQDTSANYTGTETTPDVDSGGEGRTELDAGGDGRTELDTGTDSHTEF